MYLLDQLLLEKGVKPLSYDECATIPVDYVYGHDRNTHKIVEELKLLGVDIFSDDQLSLSENFVLFMDHYSPAPSLETSGLHAQQRRIRDALGCLLFEEGSGVGHQIALESIVRPSQICLGVDSHTCTVGSIGALGLRMPPVSVAKALRDGVIEFYKPEIVRVEISGLLDQACEAKDVGLYLASLGPKVFQDVFIEFGGEGICNLSIADRAVLTNLSTDFHARGALFEVDIVTEKMFPFENIGFKSVDPKDYTRCIHVDLGLIEPYVSLPGSIFNAVRLSTIKETRPVTVVTVGSCTNGRLEDFESFLAALNGQPIASNIRVVITPGSQFVLRQLNEVGLVSKFIQLGATINPPGCGPCMGLHQGILSADDVCVATGSRNAPGRMGSTEAEIYLTGPKIAGAVARTGSIMNFRQ